MGNQRLRGRRSFCRFEQSEMVTPANQCPQQWRGELHGPRVEQKPEPVLSSAFSVTIRRSLILETIEPPAAGSMKIENEITQPMNRIAIATAILTLMAGSTYSSHAQNTTLMDQQAYIKASNTGGPLTGEPGDSKQCLGRREQFERCADGRRPL